jgi:hypothetical protein
MSERVRSLNISRAAVYAAIDLERDYQDVDVNDGIMSVGDELTLLRTYLRDAEDQYKGTFGDAHERPTMDIIRKLAGICVRCMEHHGALPRIERNRRH